MPGRIAGWIAAAARRRAARPPGGEDGYLLAAAMLLVALVAILSAKAAVGTALVHQREMEQEWRFRAERIVRAIQDFHNERTGGTGRSVGQTGWPKLEELTKPPKRYLHSIPPDPLTAEYDDNGDLKQGTGVWQPIFPGRMQPQTTRPGQRTTGSGQTHQSVSPLPCDQKSPGWEKNKQIVGVYSCADGESVMMFYDKPPGSSYRELLFYVPTTTGGTGGTGGGNSAGQAPLTTLLRCPGAECLPATQMMGSGAGTGTGTGTTSRTGTVPGQGTSPFGGRSTTP